MEMEQHVNVVGVLRIGFSVLGLLIGGAVFVFVVGGGLISGDPDAIRITGIVGTAIAGFLAVLSVPGITAVAVATPNVYHKETAIAALRAGKDVLLEKPMAMSRAECDEIVEVIAETGKLLQVGFVSRCAPAAVAVRDLLASGRLGRIYHAKATLCRQRGIPGLGRWFTTRSMSGGGVLVDVGVHHDGLVHVSEISDRFVSDPSEVVRVGQVVKVRVIGVELEEGRPRVSLSMKLEEKKTARPRGQQPPGRPRRRKKPPKPPKEKLRTLEDLLNRFGDPRKPRINPDE